LNRWAQHDPPVTFIRRARAEAEFGAASDQTASDRDQTSSDRDQTSSDRDQTASDRDQTASDRDQTASDRDEEASAHDQELAERGLAFGADRAAYEFSRRVRSRTSAERLGAANARDSAASDRLHTARDRDQVADKREARAAPRDDSTDIGGARLVHANGDGSASRNRSSQTESSRTRAAHDRDRAARDRELAVREREEAAVLRMAAARDHAEAKRERQLAGVDELTGASLRSTGLSEINREIQRSQRTGAPLVLAFVDVNHLKRINDEQGHLAGDALLREVGMTLRSNLRPYDVVVRFGGDEFVFVVPNIDIQAARTRLNEISESLEEKQLPKPISFGLAELEEGDDLEQLLRRADAALIGGRRTSQHRSRAYYGV
jgi:diguanylate cyclase (GGDEF)-like protein